MRSRLFYLPWLTYRENGIIAKLPLQKECLFLVGKIGQIEGLSIFSGFTSPFVFVPPLARYFADYLVNGEETLISFNL